MDLAEGGASRVLLARSVGRRRGHLPVAGGTATATVTVAVHPVSMGGGRFGRSGGQDERQFGLDGIFPPPFAKFALVEMEPVLLGADDHARSHEAHKGDDFVGGEAVPVDEIGADQAARTAEAGFAVDGDASFALVDCFVRQFDEFLDEGEWRAGAVVEDHVEVVDAEGGEVGWAIEFGVETDDEADVAVGEMGEDVLEWHGQVGASYCSGVLGNGGVFGRGWGNGCYGLIGLVLW